MARRPRRGSLASSRIRIGAPDSRRVPRGGVCRGKDGAGRGGGFAAVRRPATGIAVAASRRRRVRRGLGHRAGRNSGAQTAGGADARVGRLVDRGARRGVDGRRAHGSRRGAERAYLSASRPRRDARCDRRRRLVPVRGARGGAVRFRRRRGEPGLRRDGVPARRLSVRSLRHRVGRHRPARHAAGGTRRVVVGRRRRGTAASLRGRRNARARGRGRGGRFRRRTLGSARNGLAPRLRCRTTCIFRVSRA